MMIFFPLLWKGLMSGLVVNVGLMGKEPSRIILFSPRHQQTRK